MRVFYILPFLFLFNVAQAQYYVLDEAVAEPEVFSKLSFGVAPIFFIPVNEYRLGVGLGIEANISYEVVKDVTIGGFLLTKGWLNSLPPVLGVGYDDKPVMKYGSFAFGGLLEARLGGRVGVNMRLGYEEYFSYPAYNPGFIYGVGMNLYINPNGSSNIKQNFGFSFVFESENYIDFPILDVRTNTFRTTEINAFTFQFSWRLQFHSTH